jgi:hypothetical protein
MSSREKLVRAVAGSLQTETPQDIEIDSVIQQVLADLGEPVLDYWNTIKTRERALKMLRTEVRKELTKEPEEAVEIEINRTTYSIIIQEYEKGYKASMLIGEIVGYGSTPEEALVSLRKIAYENYGRKNHHN